MFVMDLTFDFEIVLESLPETRHLLCHLLTVVAYLGAEGVGLGFGSFWSRFVEDGSIQ